jgi:LacI family transcriptional regulator
VPLTSVRQPARQLGCTAVDLLLAEVTGTEPATGRQVLFEPELVVRSSTGPAAPQRSGGAR